MNEERRMCDEWAFSRERFEREAENKPASSSEE